MRNRAEREKLDREHEREAMEKRYAADSAALIKKVERSIAAKFEAAREVETAIGAVRPLAFDSADAIYGYALAQMGRSGVNKRRLAKCSEPLWTRTDKRWQWTQPPIRTGNIPESSRD